MLSYLLAMTATSVSAGRLGDLVGRRRLLLGGIIVFTLASALGAVSPGFWSLIVFRAVQGLGAAVMMALSLPLIAEVVAKEKIGRAIGMTGTVSALGTALGPSLGGILIAAFGWRAIFLVNVPVGVLTLLLAWRYLPRPVEHAKDVRVRFDLKGAMLLALILVCYTLAMTVARGVHRRCSDERRSQRSARCRVRDAEPLPQPRIDHRASLMGGIFAAASGSSNLASAHPAAIAAGMRTTFGFGAGLVVTALLIAAARSGPVLNVVSGRTHASS